MPQRGPEHEKLGYFVGKWTTEGEIKENPMGLPTGTFSGKDRCDWFDGMFAVVCKSKGKGPMGNSTGMGIMSYSAEAGFYTYYGTDSLGMTMTSIPHGEVDGKTWTYVDESEMGGQKVKNRYVMVVGSENSYTFKWEIEGPEGWTTIMEGKSTRG